MTKLEAQKRIEKLKTEINHHRYLYHVLDKQEISDAALDSLKNELFKLEQEYPELVSKDSPTQRVGGEPLKEFKKVTHTQPMLSLFDAFSPDDMRAWEERMVKILETNHPGLRPPLLRKEGIEPESPPLEGEVSRKLAGRRGIGGYYAELKMDGLAMNLLYEKSSFFQGATRGDGKVGEDVTENLKTIEAIPLSLRRPTEEELKEIGLNNNNIQLLYSNLDQGKIEVRGEAIMPMRVFENLNKQYAKAGKPIMANPRNAAAGSIRQLDSKITAERKLDFHAYSLITDLGLLRHEQEHELAKLLGFKILKENKFCKNLNEAIEFHDYWEKHKKMMPFECDGVVILVNNLELWQKLGVVGKAPRYVMAYKFAAEQVTTKVIDVVWQVGRTGTLTPTAELDPIRVGGVTVSHATLHNMDEIERLDLRIGDTIILERAGDVIPKVVQVLPKLRVGKEKKIVAPKICPICESPVEKILGEVAYRCTNKACYAVTLRNLMHWVSKGAMDIDGLGPKIIEQLMKEGLVRTIADFYKLSIDDLLPLERFANKSATNLVKAIKDKKEIDLARFIYGLGVRHVGEETALLLSKQILDFGIWNLESKKIPISKISDFIKNISLEKLQELPDIGPIVGQSIFDWFRQEHNLEILRQLENSGVFIKFENPKSKIQNPKLQGKVLVLTGSLAGLTRDEAKAKIRELGGDVSSTVSKNTDFVVVGDEPGSKYDKAVKLGVKVLNEEEFLEILK